MGVNGAAPVIMECSTGVLKPAKSALGRHPRGSHDTSDLLQGSSDVESSSHPHNFHKPSPISFGTLDIPKPKCVGTVWGHAEGAVGSEGSSAFPIPPIIPNGSAYPLSVPPTGKNLIVC